MYYTLEQPGIEYLVLLTIVLLSLVDRLNFDVVISLGSHVSRVTVDMAFLPIIAEQPITPILF